MKRGIVFVFLLWLVSTPHVFAYEPVPLGPISVEFDNCESIDNFDDYYIDILVDPATEGVQTEMLDSYKTQFPNYANYTFLEHNGFISYRAYVSNVEHNFSCTKHLDIDPNKVDEYYLVIFHSDGSLVLRSPLKSITDIGYTVEEGKIVYYWYDMNTNLLDVQQVEQGNPWRVFEIVAVIVGLILTVGILFISLMINQHYLKDVPPYKRKYYLITGIVYTVIGIFVLSTFIFFDFPTFVVPLGIVIVWLLSILTWYIMNKKQQDHIAFLDIVLSQLYSLASLMFIWLLLVLNM